MRLIEKLGRWGSMRVARRMSRAVPLVGGLMAVGVLASAMRSKGVVRGSLDTALTALPVVGGAKTVYEKVRGRDLIANRPGAR